VHSEQGDQQVQGEVVGGLQVIVVGLQGSELTQGWGVSVVSSKVALGGVIHQQVCWDLRSQEV
jgi:hypothetical protein